MLSFNIQPEKPWEGWINEYCLGKDYSEGGFRLNCWITRVGPKLGEKTLSLRVWEWLPEKLSLDGFSRISFKRVRLEVILNVLCIISIRCLTKSQ